MATVEIKTAEELADPALEARWAARRAPRETGVLRGAGAPVGEAFKLARRVFGGLLHGESPC